MGTLRHGVTHGLHPHHPVLPKWFMERLNSQPYSDEMLKLDPCPYCYQPSDSVEHVVPRSQGGSATYSNKVGACKRCNNQRSSVPFLVWIIRMRKRSVRLATGVFYREQRGGLIGSL